MEYIKKWVLTFLVGMPIASVSFAAVSKLTELEGLKAGKIFDDKVPVKSADEPYVLTSRDFLDPSYWKSKDMLFPPLTVTATWENAKERFKAKNPSLSGLEVEYEFDKVIEMLKAKGLVETNEKMIIGKGPSKPW